jgi:glycosyltransferase involved in cell wall biosynthesis
MRVLHIIPSFAPAWRYGGPIVAADGLTRTLAKLGHEVTVFTTNIDGDSILDVPTTHPVNRDGVLVWYFPVEHPRWYCFSRQLAQAMRDRVSHFEIAHIHSLFLWPTTVASFWCRKRRVPYIVHAAGMLDPACIRKMYERKSISVSSRLKKNFYLATLGRVELGRASAIHFTSETEMREAILPNIRTRGLVVPFGVDRFEDTNTGWSLLREKFPELCGRKIVLFMSRLDPKKGINFLMKAAQELLKQRDDFVVAVAGQGSRGYEFELKRLSAKLGIERQIVFTGTVTGELKNSLLQCADLFVLPSYHENFGVAAVEAMAAGLPIIISNRVNIHAEVTAAGAGLVVGLDCRELANAIAILLDDDAKRMNMGQRGQSLVESNFTWNKVAAMTVSMYETVIAQGNSNENAIGARSYLSTARSKHEIYRQR